MSLLRSFVSANQDICWKFDRLVAPSFRVDGNTDFIANFAPPYLAAGQLVFDVGAGKQPYLSPERKRENGVRVIGIDISRDELDKAPPGAYDERICADITKYQGNAKGDLAICQALLEHVPDTFAAMKGIASTLQPGGVIVLFVPCRNALFARLNLFLPESLKRRILFALFPKARQGQGFKSYYNRCTPNDFREIAQQLDLEEVEFRAYYMSGYFSFFFPAYVFWRCWTVLSRAIWGEQAAETFCMALRKK